MLFIDAFKVAFQVSRGMLNSGGSPCIPLSPLAEIRVEGRWMYFDNHDDNYNRYKISDTLFSGCRVGKREAYACKNIKLSTKSIKVNTI